MTLPRQATVGLETPNAFYKATSTDSPVETLALLLHHLDVAQRRMRIRFAHQLDLSTSEFNAVTKVASLGETTPKVLAETLRLTTGAVTAMLDRLETADFLERKRNPNDRRSVLLVLTARARTRLENVYRDYYHAVRHAIETADTLDVDRFSADIQHIATAISESVDDFDATASL